MAGKSNKSRNRGKGSTAISSHVKAVPSPHQVASDLDASSKAATTAATPLSDLGENGTVAATPGDKSVSLDDVSSSKSDAPTAASNDRSKHVEVTGDLHLYAVPVKTQSGEKLELQLNPADSIMDLRQFLLDAPETCFYTCYDLLLRAKDGSVHQMEDYNEISEVADITSGGCSLEMVAALYNYRSIRSHVRRAKELLSMSALHSSLSTFLGLQHEAKQKKPADAAKNDALELDGLGFMEDISGSLGCLLSTSLSKEAKCVESVIFSSFNPPPSYRRLVGDLIYLDVITLEGHKYCITGSTRNFYVNASTPSVFDCKPAKPANEATTLIGLLQKISSKFKKGFSEILERKASAHPFENVQTPLPANSWLGAYPTPEHVPDVSRAEDALVLSFGSELIGMQRDWNEELQSCREFPYKTPQERILRDRALYKVTCDFVDAAVSGAIGVINRCIPPINPTDPECFHMYVHNNIFFSFAVDADLRQMPKSNLVDAKGKIQPDLNFQEGTRSLHKSLDMNTIDGADSGSEQNLMNCSTISDVPADISSETQLADSEQATYASANNDLKGTKLYQEADVPGLYNLAMTIIDYRGHRVVAQSIIPGILQGDKSDSLLYGSVDSGKKICWNEPFHAKVVEAAKRLHLKEHTVLDGNENIIRLAAPVECKGIVGSDERHYLLDLMRVTPRDANYIGPGYRFCVLRPELIAAFCQAKKPKSLLDGKDSTINAGVEANETVVCSNSESAEPVLNDKLAEECSSASLNNSMRREEILLNPNVFTEFKLAGSQEEIAADEAEVMKASSYLLDIVLPKFVQDLFSLEASPMDGQTLTEALHAHGINVRYIGKIADMTKGLPHLWNLCVSEIVVRSAKHILKEWLRDSQDHELGPAVAHFFNCFLGDVPISTKNSTTNALTRNQKKDQTSHQFSGKLGKSSAKANQGSSLLKTQISSYMDFCCQNLWDDILAFAKYKYEFVLPEHVRKQVKQISTVRNLCQKVGLVISARRYDLESSFPFQTADILDLQPVVKHSVPLCKEAKDLVETGKTKLAEGMLNEAYTLFSEAFSILQQVTGPMHREVANCCKYLAMVLYHAGDMAGAIMQQHKELIINERCLGLDHPDTAHSYGNMALFYHGLNQTELALRHMSQTLLLLGLSCGPDHPDVAATFINVAMMYQDIGKMNIALRYLQEALKKNEFLLGKEHIQTAVCYHALAIAFNCMGAYKLSIQHEKKTYDILVKQLGEDDSRTRDSQTWIKTFKMRDLQLNAQKQKGQAIDATSAQKAIDIIKAHPDLVQAFQAAAGGPAVLGSSANRSLNAALIGENFSRGRGFDERAARAAAEVRKKAAAKGLPVRSQHGASVQPLSPLTQLLNVINTGASPSEGEQANESEKGINAPTENGVLGDKANKSTAAQEATPVGLGTGLGSLEPKKQKQKNRDSNPK